MAHECDFSRGSFELSDAQYREIWSRLDDATIAAIDRTGATLGECEQAMLWAFSNAEAQHTIGRPPGGAVGRVYDILIAALADGNDDYE